VPDGLPGYHGPVAFDGAVILGVGAFFDPEEGSSKAVMFDDLASYPESLIMNGDAVLDNVAVLNNAVVLNDTAALNDTDL
jgi:hypothetical protein